MIRRLLYNYSIIALMVMSVVLSALAQEHLNGEATITVSSKGIRVQEITFEGPLQWKGFLLRFTLGEKFNGKGTLKEKNGHSVFAYTIEASREDISGLPFNLFIGNELIVSIHSFYEYINATNNIRNNAEHDRLQIKLFAAEVGNTDWVLSVRVSNEKGMLSSLQELSQSNLKDGSMYLMISSHQDTGWEDTPMQCEIDRDSLVITPALAYLKQIPDYRFNVENMLSLKEYLGRHPEKREEIYQLTKEGRISWGAMYNQTYEGMWPGESLTRQFYFGRKWLMDNFPGLDTRIVWNVDVPERTIQAAQLMYKAGVKYLLISRQSQGIFEWESPDGSRVKVYSSGDYGETWRQLTKSHYRTFKHFADFALDYRQYNQNTGKKAAIPFMASKDMSPPYTYQNTISQWNSLKSWQMHDGKQVKLNLPTIRYATPLEFFDAFEKNVSEVPVIRGERPNVWVYIHGPSHHRLMDEIRQGSFTLTAAEKFSVFDALLEGSWNNYPQEKFNKAWEAHIYPDHGMGGKNGHITDQVFLDKTVWARKVGDSILTQSMKNIAGKINREDSKGIPLVVFNSLSWARTNVVTTHLDLKDMQAKNIKLVDNTGKDIPFQLVGSENRNSFYEGIDISFLAENVPSLGYKTFFVHLVKNMVPPVQAKSQAHLDGIENEYYKIQLVEGGIAQIVDKQLNKNLFSTEKFLVGELFSFQSVGTDAGEFADVQQPSMEGFEKFSSYKAQWGNYKNDPVSQSVELTQKVKHALVVQKVILYHKIKKIDIKTSLLGWDGTQYREFRLAFPINIPRAQVAYEVPYGKVEIGKDEIPGAAGERYTGKASEVRPRSILNWMGAYNEDVGVTISSSVSVWDFKDPTERPVDYPVLQPLLLASRRSCHVQGNWYLQEGDHHYTFSIFSHKPDWRNGQLKTLEANEPLLTVFNPPQKAKPVLPLSASFFSIEAKNAVISTIKKRDNSDIPILRVYETEGIPASLGLKSFFNFDGMMKCSLIEEIGDKVESMDSAKIGKYSIETFALKTK